MLVVYDGDKKKEKKTRHHSSKDKEGSRDKDRKRKGSTSSSDSKALAIIHSPPLTPAGEDDFDFPDDHIADTRLPYESSVMSLAPALLQNVTGGQAQQILGFGQQMIAMMDPSGDSPLTALLVRLTDILDTFDCLNASITTLVASLQKDPDALAMVGLTLAEIAAVVAKTAPGVVVAAKAAFPVIFGLLGSPQFLVTAGATVIIIGGYQIIRRVAGLGAAAVAPAPPTPKALEDEDHLAFGPGMDDVYSEPEDVDVVKKTPAAIMDKKDREKKKAITTTFPPTPPLTPAAESPRKQLVRSGTAIGSVSASGSAAAAAVPPKVGELVERPKLLREGSKRLALRNLLTRANTMS